MPKLRYIALTGVTYRLQSGPGEGRAEAGQDVPAYVVRRSPWLVEQGHVRAEDAPTGDAPAQEGGDE